MQDDRKNESKGVGDSDLPKGRTPYIRVMAMPADTNPYGDVFGGWIMAQVDVAGAQPAMQLSEGRVATVAVNSFVFKQPVLIGDLVSFYAEVIKVGRTSVTVKVDVYAERHGESSGVVKVTDATLTYVATDENRKPRFITQSLSTQSKVEPRQRPATDI